MCATGEDSVASRYRAYRGSGGLTRPEPLALFQALLPPLPPAGRRGGSGVGGSRCGPDRGAEPPAPRAFHGVKAGGGRGRRRQRGGRDGPSVGHPASGGGVCWPRCGGLGTPPPRRRSRAGNTDHVAHHRGQLSALSHLASPAHTKLRVSAGTRARPPKGAVHFQPPACRLRFGSSCCAHRLCALPRHMRCASGQYDPASRTTQSFTGCTALPTGAGAGLFRPSLTKRNRPSRAGS